MDQPKLERLLRLMKMLTANSYLTVEDIAGKLSISTRSVYRYIDTFREAGFVIKKKNNCIRLDKSSPYFKDISELIHFTEEEAYILKQNLKKITDSERILDTEVCSYEGVGRFVLGLMGDIVIVEPPEFLHYISCEVKKMTDSLQPARR